MNIRGLFHSHREIAMGALASMFARAMFTVTMLITTGIATRCFTEEEFGFWAILLSFIYFGFALDFGFRSGLGNRLAAMVADSSSQTDTRDFFLSIFYLQLAIGIGGAFLFGVFGSAVPWANLLKLHQPEMVGYINRLMTLVLCILFINVPFLISGTAFAAFQEVHLDALLNAVQWATLLGVFLFSVSIRGLPFFEVILWYFLANLLVCVTRTVILFHHRKWHLAWVPVTEQVRNIKAIFSVSSHFFFLNISALIVSTGGTFLAGLVGGLADAGNFNLIQRLFGVLLTMHIALMAPFAPAFTQGARLGDWKGVSRKLSFCLYFVVPLLFIGVGVTIWISHPIILKLWTGRNLSNYTLAGLFALFALFMGWGNTNSILLNSLGLAKAQAIWSLITAPIYLFLTFYFGRSLGVQGVALAGVLCAIPGMIYFTYYTRQAIKWRRINV